jgi:hypothetical protein
VQGEGIVKSETAPASPTVDSLWIDKGMNPMRMKLWTGSSWEIVGYEPMEAPDPIEPGDTEPDKDLEESETDTVDQNETDDAEETDEEKGGDA